MVTREVIDAGVKGKLKVVGRAGVGTDNIDIKAAVENGVIVKSAPFGNTNATAELALALMLSISRRVAQGHQLFEKGCLEKEVFRRYRTFRQDNGPNWLRKNRAEIK